MQQQRQNAIFIFDIQLLFTALLYNYVYNTNTIQINKVKVNDIAIEMQK